MNFTREPIIETIVSPKDGHKLCIRNSKVSGSEEFFVDAVEVVSFGPSFFFRGLERPKPFLVPVSDYEVFEVKETRVVLKNITHDRNIKIGGGREASLKSAKDTSTEKKEETKDGELVAAGDSATDPKGDKKRDRRRSRRRRVAEEKKEDSKDDDDDDDDKSQESQDAQEVRETQEALKTKETSESKVEAPEGEERPVLEVPTFSQMLPPPTVLISERLSQLRAKEIADGLVSEDALGEEGKGLIEEASPEGLAKAVEEEVAASKPSKASKVTKAKEELIQEEISADESSKVTSEEDVDSNVEEVPSKEHAKVNTQEEENFNF